MRFRPLVALLACALLAAACAKHGNSGPDASRDIVTHAQLIENHFQNAYDAIAALRSNWLQVRGTDSFVSPSEIVVYYDDVKLGGVAQLRTIPTETIEYIRHYSGTDATTRWGVGHSAGVILVSSRKETEH